MLQKISYFLVGCAVVILIFVIGTRIWGGEDNWICNNNQWVKHGHPSVEMPKTGCGLEINNNNTNDTNQTAIANPASQYCIEQGGTSEIRDDNTNTGAQVGFCKFPNGKECDEWAFFRKECTQELEPNITVGSPKPNDEVGLPLEISGTARVFENQFNYRLKDEDGSILVQGTAMSSATDAGQFGAFNISVNYPEPKGLSGVVEVFDYSAKDGSEVDLVSIPVKFGKVEATTVKVYFGNSTKGSSEDCGKVFALNRRVAKTAEVAQVAINELLVGPTDQEKIDNYFSSINPTTKLNKITIVNGVATVDFSQEIAQQFGGSCRLENLTAQINFTLKQFKTVKNVVITVDGKSAEEVLQP